MSEKNGGGAVREQLLAARRRKIATTLGFEVQVRALGYADLSALMGVLLDVSTLGEEAKKTSAEDLVKTPKGVAVLASVEKVLIAGCVEPKLGSDPAAGPVPADLPIPDQLAIFTAILELSGYSKEAGAAVRP
jgi:hypothetical protein